MACLLDSILFSYSYGDASSTYSTMTVHVNLGAYIGRIPIWYEVKLGMVAWLVLPQFRGAAFIYNKFVREKLIKKYGSSYIHHKSQSPDGKTKNKIVDYITLKKVKF
ncbi:hypothetical protein H5410_017342 [Solanum commersonii]|uniref:HVA22-like protein n=1 Tax=Solanum commersonii TaxID=4109 RepID=A0A9J5ZYU2_SOLCO|nr:hypothetical protein H5410_017342 [Solanum commersonii]